MRIIYIIDKPRLYGSEKHLFDIAKYFKANNQVFVIAFSDGMLLEILSTNGIGFSIQSLNWFPNFINIFRIAKMIKMFKADIIHNHQPKAGFYGSIIGRFLRIPVINTIHSGIDDNILVQGNKVSKLATHFFHLNVRFISELFARKNIFVSATSQKNCFLKKKSIVIYNWINNVGNGILRDDKLHDRKLKLLAVGFVTPGKGYDLLIDFLKEIKEIDYEMKILGDGNIWYIEELKKEINKFNLKVVFCGYQDSTESYYRWADFFILFSRSETFGISYIEAASYGLPVVALALPVLREILPDCNLLSNNIVQLAMDFKKLLNDQDEYDRISLVNMERVQKRFSFQKSIKELFNVYNSVLSNTYS